MPVRGKVPGTLWLLLSLAAVIAAWQWNHRQPALGQKAIFDNGMELTLSAVTFGYEHHVTKATAAARFLAHFPDKWVSRWQWTRKWQTGIEEAYARFSEPHLVLWFIAPGKTNGPYPNDPGFSSWRITGPKGSENGGGLSRSVGQNNVPSLFPVFIDSYPRRLSKFTVELWQQVRAKPGEPDSRLAGRFLIRNPMRSRARRWKAEALPAQQSTPVLDCVLKSFSVQPNAPAGTKATNGLMVEPALVETLVTTRRELGSSGFSGQGGGSFTLRDDSRIGVAEVELMDKTVAREGWDVHQCQLLDPTGNTSFARWTASQDPDGKTQVRCRAVPLWLDDPTWKLQLDVVARGKPDQVVQVRGVPFPVAPQARRLVVRTNVLGWRLNVYSHGARDLAKMEASSVLRMTPWIEFELEGPSNRLQPVMELLEVKDAAGTPLKEASLNPDRLFNVKNWCLDFAHFPAATNPLAPTQLELTLGVKEQRRFEFYVPSGWSKAGAPSVHRTLPPPSSLYE